MDEPGQKKPPGLSLLQKAAIPGRRRSAAVARETSDVTRFRGLAWASALSAATVVLAIVLTQGIGSLGSPGPLSRSHARAGLECQACHAFEPALRACSGCHGSQESTRRGHQRLREGGELSCGSCHAAHGGADSISFFPDGQILRSSAGIESAILPAKLAVRVTNPTTVPIVPAARCAGCHALSNPRDPVAPCLLSGKPGRGSAGPSVCFDEHRPVATPGSSRASGSSATAERDAAVLAASEIVSRDAAWITAGSARGRPALWLCAGLFVGFVAFGTSRVWRRRRVNARPTALPLLTPEVVRLPQIDPNTCLGCYACVDACPYDVLEVERFIAVVARPDACCGLTLCEQRCPNGSLVVQEGERLDDRPKTSATLESLDVPGLYLAGDLTGLPLIRNALNQGAHAARAIFEDLERTTPRRTRSGDMLDLVIVGAGPAGISAALEAKSRRLETRVLEQGSIAESIRSFPRGKIVLDQPLGTAETQQLWLGECTKEELLGKWLRVVRRERLAVSEGCRVTSITRSTALGAGGAFDVHALAADGSSTRLRARRVLVAIGRRGSPRKLAASVPSEALNHVFYSLADARSFAGQRVLIVGLGDVALEAAIALARQPETRVVISYRGREFRRGKARNIDEVRRLVKAGRLEILWESAVVAVGASGVTLSSPDGPRAVDCDAMFVMIGSIAAWDVLATAGIAIGQEAVEARD